MNECAFVSVGIQSVEQQCGGALEWQKPQAVILLLDPEQQHRQLHLDV